MCGIIVGVYCLANSLFFVFVIVCLFVVYWSLIGCCIVCSMVSSVLAFYRFVSVRVSVRYWLLSGCFPCAISCYCSLCVLVCDCLFIGSSLVADLLCIGVHCVYESIVSMCVLPFVLCCLFVNN